MLCCNLSVGIGLAYHCMHTMYDKNSLSTLRSFSIPPIGYNIYLTLLLWFRDLEVLWFAISQDLALAVSDQYFVTEKQGSPQDHNSPFQHTNYNGIQKLIIFIFV